MKKWLRKLEEYAKNTLKAMLRFFSNLTMWMMLITVVITGLALWHVPALYKQVVNKSNISVCERLSGVKLSSDHPVWFRIEGDSLSTNKAMEHGDVLELRSLVSDTCTNYPLYVKAIGKLAYKSNNDTTNLVDLVWLTLCYVLLGCCARTFFDFIGHKCYKKDQEMKQWWPWYIFRPLMCAPIASLLIVSVRTSFFSNLFVSKDLNTYLVISFVAGFAIMEFLTMLRRLSKSLLADPVESKPTDNPNPQTNTNR